MIVGEGDQRLGGDQGLRDCAGDRVGVAAGDADERQRWEQLVAQVGPLCAVHEAAATGVREERVDAELGPQLSDREERVCEGLDAAHVGDQLVVISAESVSRDHWHVADDGCDVLGAGGRAECVGTRAMVDEPMGIGRHVPGAPRVDRAIDVAAADRFLAGRLNRGLQPFRRRRFVRHHEGGEEVVIGAMRRRVSA